MIDFGVQFYEFGPFRVDVGNRLLLREGQPLTLTPKAVETLIALVEHGGQLLKKEELIGIVWPDRVVDESNLTQNIYLLRKTLNEGSNGHNYIETVPRRGYRFVGKVRESAAAGTNLILAATPNLRPVFESPRDAAARVGEPGTQMLWNSRADNVPSQRLLPSRGPRRNLSIAFLIGGLVIVAALAYLAFLKVTRTRADRLAASTGAFDSSPISLDKFGAQHLTANPDAFRAYVQGRHYWSRETTPALEQAIQQFQEALRHDPAYPLPYAGLAEAYGTLSSHYDRREIDADDAMSKAKAAAARAVELNGSLAETHTAFGIIKERYDWDWSGAEQEFKRAIESNPNYAHAHQEYSRYLSAVGRPAEAEAEIKRARELEPTSLSIGKDVGDWYYLAHDYEQALEQYRRALKLDPTDPVGISIHRAMAWAYEFHGMHEQAVSEFIETARIQNAAPERLSAFRKGYDAGGMKGYWRAWLELQRERMGRGGINPFYLAEVYTFIKNYDQAFAQLQRACDDHALDAAALRSSPNLDDLRKDERYTAILRRVGLVP